MSKSKILIVEDDPFMARMYQRIFTLEDYKVMIAGNGRDGLAKVKSQKPDLILLDIMMPEMNGLEVLERLQADASTKAVPVVVLTNLAGKQDAKLALSKGALKYIIKSEQDPKEVVEMVKRILAKKS